MHKKGLAELLGEYCRDASVLVLVFGFLDGYRDNTITVGLTVGIFGISLVLFWIGYMFERYRRI
jgi:hypothetical protein